MATGSLIEFVDRGDTDERLSAGPLRRIVAEVRAGHAGRLFPPIGDPGPAGTIVCNRYLHGDSDARLVARALSDQRFAPLVNLLESVDNWCTLAAKEFADVVRPGVLRITNAALFGPLVRDVFVACGTRDRPSGWRLALDQNRMCAEFLGLFLRRLRRDLGSRSWPTAHEFVGPVTGLRAIGEETHNGRQWVLGLDLAGGARIAYKARPASGKRLFVAPGGIFDTLNNRPTSSGKIRLPVMQVWTGDADDHWAYGWEEWACSLAGRAMLRRDGDHCLRGPRLNRQEAARFWHRAGSLAVAAFGYGITDLTGDNLRAATTTGSDDPLYYPSDIEFYFADVGRLCDTGLVQQPPPGGSHQAGFGDAARWRAPEGPSHYLMRVTSRTLELHERTQPTARQSTDSVLTDTDGRVGYGPYIPALLRGMFDAWTVMCANRRQITELVDHGGEHRYVRVLRRPTAAYSAALAGRLQRTDVRRPCGEFDDAELPQLRRLDVPYFFRSEAGGDLLQMQPPPSLDRVPVDAAPPDWPQASAAAPRGDNLSLSGLGVALRDAVTYVFDNLVEHGLTDREVVDSRYGVHLYVQAPGEGQVGFDWPQRQRRITYQWTTGNLGMRISRLDQSPLPVEPCIAGNIRLRLQRIDRADAALRKRWVASSCTDEKTARQLRILTDLGLNWLEEIIDDHGWPGQAMVGLAATSAARRLVQHAEDQAAFQHKCLRLMRKAAMAGDLPWREVACLTDAVRLAAESPQRLITS